MNLRDHLPELLPDSVADETPRRIGFVGIVLYSLYTLFFVLGAPLVAITTKTIFDGISFIALASLIAFITIYYPFKLTREFYATGVITPNRNGIYMCGLSTFVSILSVALVPLAVYNIALGLYYYKHLKE